MKEMLAMKVEPGGKVYNVVEELVLEEPEELELELLDMLEEFGSLMVVVAVEVWGIEEGATLAILWI